MLYNYNIIKRPNADCNVLESLQSTANNLILGCVKTISFAKPLRKLHHPLVSECPKLQVLLNFS